MPKKDTGYTPSRSKSNPTAKQNQPMKTPSIKSNGLPQAIKAPNSIASLPKSTAIPKVSGSISRPAPLAPRTPRI